MIKKSIFFVYSLMCLLGLSGCLTKSINPFYTQETAIETPKGMEGKWRTIKSRNEDIPSKEALDINIKGNQMIVTERGKISIFLDIQFFKVKGQDYIDFALNAHHHKLEKFNDYIKLTHGVFKIEKVTKGIALTPINPKWLSDFLKKHPSIGAIEEGDCKEYCEIMLTAPSKDLVRMLKGMKNNKQAFPVDDKVILKKI